MKERQLKFFHSLYDEEKNLFSRRHIIKIPLDTLILLSVINLLFIVVSFSLGTERGRKSAQIVTKARIEEKSEILPLVAEENIQQDDKKVVETSKEKNIEEDEKEKQIKKYIVQVASYLKKDTANKEKEYLESCGFSTIVSQKGKYLVIYVGEFKTKKEAEKTKTILKKRYNDCFIRKL